MTSITCLTCRGSGAIVGRVDHVRTTTSPSATSSGSYFLRTSCHQQGVIPCPYCNPLAYGDIVNVEVQHAAYAREGRDSGGICQ